MNSPATISGSELYVHLNPSIAAQLQRIAPSLNSTEDVHICGGCKQSFPDINLFVEHKHAGCTGTTHNPLSVIDVSLDHPNLSYISSNGDNSVTNHVSQYLRVVLNGSSVPLHLQEQSGLSKQELLQNILLSQSFRKAEVVITNQQGSSLESCSTQNSVIQQPKNENKSKKDKETVHTKTSSNDEVVPLSAAAITCHEQDTLLNLNIEDNSFIVADKETTELRSIQIQQNNSEAIIPAFSNSSSGGISNKYRENSVDRTTDCPDKLLCQSDTICTKQNDTKEKQDYCTVIIHEGPEEILAGDYQTLSENTIDSTSSAYPDCTKKKRTCPVTNCKFTTPYPKDMVRHMRKHTGERPYQCEFCKRTYSRIDKLQAHQHIHFGEKCHKCQVCTYATVDKCSLKKHMRIHNGERPFKCQICPYRAKRSCHLTVHLRTHTGDHPFVCPYESCMSAFKTSSDLKRHIRMHTGETPYACDICDYRCSIKSNLGVHIRVHHARENLIPCTICNHVSVSEGAAREHEKIHSGDSQSVTATCLPQKRYNGSKKNAGGNVRKHTRKRHPSSKSYKKSKGKDAYKMTGSEHTRSTNAVKSYCVKAHKCPLCDAAFVREDSWRSHMRQHQNQGAYLGTINDSETLASVRSIAEEGEKNSSLETVLVSSRSPPVQSKHTQAVTVLDNNTEGGEVSLTSNDLEAADSETLVNSNVIVENESSNMALQEPRDECTASFTSDLQDKADKNENVEEVEMHSVLENDPLQTEPVFLYVQNGVLEEGTIDEGFHNSGVLTSLNQSDSVILTGRCGQYISVPSDQSALVDQITASLQSDVQYVLSTPMDSLADADDTCVKVSSDATKEKF